MMARSRGNVVRACTSCPIFNIISNFFHQPSENDVNKLNLSELDFISHIGGAIGGDSSPDEQPRGKDPRVLKIKLKQHALAWLSNKSWWY